MPIVTGVLQYVTQRPDNVDEIWVRAPEVRAHSGGLITRNPDRYKVTDGNVSFQAAPGPAVLALISRGRAVDTIPILVGDGDTQSLRQVVTAARIADDATQREIDKLTAKVIELVDSSKETNRKVQEGVARAETAERNAKQSETNAATSAGGAKASASSASTNASKAAVSEKNAASSASSAKADASKSAVSEKNAASYASSAKNDADRAEKVAESTSWDGDQLTVNGKTSPHLTGPKGDRGPAGESGKWTDLTGVPTKFPPESHKHQVADITDLPTIDKNAKPSTLVQRWNDGTLSVPANPGTSNNSATSKWYVDTTTDAVKRSGQLFFGSWDTKEKGNFLFIATPRLAGKVEFKSTFDGTGRALVMPVVYDDKGSVVHSTVDAWGVTSAYHYGPFNYGVGATTHTITLPAGYWIDGVVIGGWDGNSVLRGLEFTAERVTPVQTTAAEYSTVQAFELRANKDLGGRLIKSDNNGCITVHDDMFANYPNAVVNKRYVDTAAAGKADKSHKHSVSDITGLPVVSDSVTNGTLVKRSENGTIRAADPKGPNNVATQKYVDDRIQLVTSLPSSPDPNVLYVIAE